MRLPRMRLARTNLIRRWRRDLTLRCAILADIFGIEVHRSVAL